MKNLKWGTKWVIINDIYCFIFKYLIYKISIPQSDTSGIRKASFTFNTIIPKNTQMTTFHINLSLYITLTNIYYIDYIRQEFVSYLYKFLISILHQGDIRSVYSQCHVDSLSCKEIQV